MAITQELGHVFILTDLLLICERMTPQELARSGPDGADMWLLYPPLAGKHLRVAPAEGSGQYSHLRTATWALTEPQIPRWL